MNTLAHAQRAYALAVHESPIRTDATGVQHDLHRVGLTTERAEALITLARNAGVKRTFETGLAYGLSSLALLEAIAGSGDADARHVAIDPHQDRLWGGIGRQLAGESPAGHLFRFIAQDSALALPKMVSEQQTFDLAFIDGGHLFEVAFLDVYYATRLVKPGGLIVIDDVWMPAVRDATAYAELNLMCQAVEGPHEDAGFRLLQTPERRPQRNWDHYVPFAQMSKSAVA